MRKVLIPILACFLLAGGAALGDDERMAKRRNDVVRAIDASAPAVVNISTDEIIDRDFFRGWDLFGGPRVGHSLGTGGIFTASGYAFTNAHVVNQASAIRVKLRDGREYSAELVNVDVDSDIAVIKIRADEPLPTLVFGRSDDLMVGEKAIAVGNPFGLSDSVTTGIISAVNRDIEAEGRLYFSDVIQTDAPINRGNSGGPLLNIFGEVIGVTSAIRAGAQGIGFAIPIDRVKESLAAILHDSYTRSRRLSLGLEIAPEYPGDGPDMALRVAEIDRSGPAERAGVRVGDIVTALDGEIALDTLAHFRAAILESGDAVTLTLLRNGRKVTVRLEPAAIPKPDGKKLAASMLGLSVRKIDSEVAALLGLRRPQGVLIAGVARGSSGRRARLRSGDVIVQVNRSFIGTMDDLALALEAAEGAGRLIMRVIRREGLFTLRYTVEMETRRPNGPAPNSPAPNSIDTRGAGS